MSEKKSPHRFKVGDRVIYHVGSGVGYDMLDGRVGTVIGVDTSNLPYTVEFDEEFPDAMEDLFFGGKPGHCWCCADERLSPTGTKRKNKKGNPGYAGENCGMTEAEISKVREMIEAGKPMVNIAYELGMPLITLKNKLYVLRQRDPSFPRAHRGEKREKHEDGGGEDAPGDRVERTLESSCERLAAGGTLNDLEAVLADRVRELTEKNGELEEQIMDLKRAMVRMHDENCSLRDEIGDKDEVIDSLSRRILVADKLENSYADLKIELEKREAESAAQFDKIAELTGEIRRLTDMCMKLTERFVLGET